MDEMNDFFRSQRKLEKELCSACGIDEARHTAMIMAEIGVFELTEQHREIISYLSENSIGFDDRSGLGSVLSRLSLDEVKEKLRLLREYAPDGKYTLSQIYGVSAELIDGYNALWNDLGFGRAEAQTLTAEIIKMLPVCKTPGDAREAAGCLGVFGLSAEQIRAFITENGNYSYLFNDFSRGIEKTFSRLISEHGDGAFEYLREHPEIIRLGKPFGE